MIALRKHLTTPTLYLEQAKEEYDTIDVYYLNVFGYRAPFGPPWYDLFKDWYVIQYSNNYVTLSKYPILPPRKGWGSRVFWLLSFIKAKDCSLCRHRADLMDVTYIPYPTIIEWFSSSLPQGIRCRLVYFILGVFLLCVELSWHKWNVQIKNRLLELLAIVKSPPISTNVHSTMN